MSAEVERLRADVRAAYAERDEMWERKAAALRERDEARRELAEARAEVERLAEYGVKERERHVAKLASLSALADRCREKDWAHSAEQAKRREEAEQESAGWRNAVARVLAKPLLRGPNAEHVVRVADVRAAMDAPLCRENTSTAGPVS